MTRHATYLVVTALTLFPQRALAVDLRAVHTEYSLASWSIKDGLPSNIISAIAQDAIGYLWLGTDAGLVRFDGVRFVVWDGGHPPRLPRTSVRSLLVGRDGALWIGYGGIGSIARVDRDGVIRFFDERDGLTTGSVSALAEDPDDVVWAVSGGTLYQFGSERWHRVSAPDGIDQGQIGGLFVDQAGTVFVGATSGVFRRPVGRDTFELVENLREVARAVSRDPDGEVWVTDPVIGFKKLGARHAAPARQGRGSRLLHDRNGTLWVATVGQGLWRISRKPSQDGTGADAVAVVPGLLSPGIRCLFEDRDGNIWVGTAEGLNRLTESRVTPITNVGLVSAVESAGDGSVWVAASDQLLRFSPSPADWEGRRQLLSSERIRAFHADEGAVWVADNDGLLRISSGRRFRVPIPNRTLANRISSLAPDRRGGVWFFGLDRRLFHWTLDRLEAFDSAPELSQSRVSSMYVDRGGRLWVASLSGQLSTVEPSGETQSFTRSDGLGNGPYTAFYEDRSNALWFGGSDGITRYTNGRFDAISAANGFPSSVLAVVDDDDGYLWLGTSIGIVRLDPREFDRAVEDRTHHIQYRLYDASDGLAGCPIWQGSNNAARAGDGRLWFLTSKGLTIINPRSFDTPRRTPTVHVETIMADERPLAPSAGAVLPAGTTRLRVDYTAVDLSSPLKVHFRYKLEGFDNGWIDAGSRRQALYMNLPPRSYRFHVQASNTDGTWTEAHAMWAFTLLPMVYQTTWFRMISLAALALLVWSVWEFRLRRVQRHFTSLLGERIRLSREIHDTLLQSLVGVALQFDAVSNRDDAPPAMRDQLIAIRQQVEGYIREARHSIWNLRSPLLESRELSDALRETAQRVAAGAGIHFTFELNGTAIRCSRHLEEQVLRIGQEAVMNAVRHAHASAIRMALSYGGSALRLEVSDNGHGFSGDDASSARVGHYGIASMKERAAEVGGFIRLQSARGHGTTIETVVPLTLEV